MSDVVVIGAGFAGCTSARVLAEKGHTVNIYEKKSHIGGNCYDEIDKNGILIHRYGPHLFHTSHENVWKFLSMFTSWHLYEHKVLAHIKNKNVPIPFNFNTIKMLFHENKAQKIIRLLLDNYEENTKIPILKLRKNTNKDLKKLADFIYEFVFKNYTAKQWNVLPEELDPKVSARVPIFIGYDNRYFNDTYQAVPKDGYTKLLKNMIKHANITLHVNINPLEKCTLENEHLFFDGKKPKLIIYTGAIDELFGFCFGDLSYRSVKMEFESINKNRFQEATTINYPNDYKFTRITEFKYIHPVKTDKTTILKEYPVSYIRNKNIPYYPLFTDEAKKAYKRYKNKALKYKNLLLLGRLAEYKYYDMDDVVFSALKIIKKIKI